MPSLERFQSEMAAALSNNSHDCPAAVTVAGQSPGEQSRRFNIYRNNRAVSLIENLRATYPAVCKLVGDSFFNAVAREYIDQYPPLSPVLAEYGDGFGSFLCKLPGANGIAYVADVARIEWARNLAFHAADLTVLRVQDLASVSPQTLTDQRLELHPSVVLIRSEWPVGSLWAATLGGVESAGSIDIKSPESVIVCRPQWDICVHVITDQTALFLQALADNLTIGQAAELQLQADASFDTGKLFCQLIEQGVFLPIQQ